MPKLNIMQTLPVRGHVLVLSRNHTESISLEYQLLHLGFSVLLAFNEQQAVELFDEEDFNIVFIEEYLPDIYYGNFIKYIRTYDVNRLVSIVFVTTHDNTRVLPDYISTGVDDFMLKPFTTAELDFRITVLDHVRNEKYTYIKSKQEMIAAHQTLSEFFSARNDNVEDMQVFCRTPDIFSGDYLLSTRQPNGDLYVLLIDFSGHGLSSAICVLPIVDIFYSMIDECFKAEEVLEKINRKLFTLLPIKMFMAAIMLKVHSDSRNISIWNAGMPKIYLLDSISGCIKQRVESNHVPLGVVDSDHNSFECVTIETQPDDLVVMHSDGFIESVDLSGNMFGVTRLEKLLENTEFGECFFSTIVKEFDEFCADTLAEDDITFVVVPCS